MPSFLKFCGKIQKNFGRIFKNGLKTYDNYSRPKTIYGATGKKTENSDEKTLNGFFFQCLSEKFDLLNFLNFRNQNEENYTILFKFAP